MVYSYIVFHCIYVPHLPYLFTCWWTFRLLEKWLLTSVTGNGRGLWNLSSVVCWISLSAVVLISTWFLLQSTHQPSFPKMWGFSEKGSILVELNVSSYTMYRNLSSTHCSCKLWRFLGRRACGVGTGVELWGTGQNPVWIMAVPLTYWRQRTDYLVLAL